MIKYILALGVFLSTPMWAQPPGAAGAKPAAPNARRTAPFDPEGYWVAQITEDWHYRIKAAAKGDVGGIPVNAQARRAAAAWDPEKDAAAGEACKAYGVGGILRMPGRLHITWEGDNALKMETDSGSQMRMLAFGQPGGQGGDWQGVSIATWDRQAPALSGFTLGNASGGALSLKIVTTKAKPGYLARNGVPYSANAVFTEYYDVFQVPGVETLLVVTVEVTDPENLSTPYWYSVHFKKQVDATGWSPKPCSAK